MPHSRIRYYRVCKWDRYQLYHDGRMMKFFIVQVQNDPLSGRVGVQNDDAFMELTDTEKVQLLSLFVLAARTGNKIPDRGRFVEFHNLSSEPLDFQNFVTKSFLELVEEPAETSLPPHVQPVQAVQPPVQAVLRSDQSQKRVDKKSEQTANGNGSDTVEKQAVLSLLLAEISDANDETRSILAGRASMLPVAAFAAARERLIERRHGVPRLDSEARYVSSLLRDYAKDGRYAA